MPPSSQEPSPSGRVGGSRAGRELAFSQIHSESFWYMYMTATTVYRHLHTFQTGGKASFFADYTRQSPEPRLRVVDVTDSRGVFKHRAADDRVPQHRSIAMVHCI